MKSSVTVAVVLAVVAARGVQASAYAVTPSAAQAKHATRLEVLTRYTVLDAHAQPRHPVSLNIGCNRLRQRLYRCSFFGETVASTDQHMYVIHGRSMVRFDKRAHVRLYNLSCTRYNLSTPTTIDFGC